MSPLGSGPAGLLAGFGSPPTRRSSKSRTDLDPDSVERLRGTYGDHSQPRRQPGRARARRGLLATAPGPAKAAPGSEPGPGRRANEQI